MTVRTAVLCLAMAACSRSATTTTAEAPPAPLRDAARSSPDAAAPSAPVPVVDAPAPSASPGTAAGPRSAYAAKTVADCVKTPPPADCASDAECASFDVPTMDGPCPSTLKLGVRADAQKAYLDARPITCTRPEHAASCVVHWDRPEEGPEQRPPGARIGVHCSKRAGAARGACRTHYVVP